MNIKQIYFLLLATVVIVACENEDDDQANVIDIGQKYNEHYLGKNWVYEIDSIVYDDFSQTVDTIRFQRRIVLEEKLESNIDETAYKAAVYERASDSLKWNKLKFDKWLFTSRHLINQIDNVQILRLVLPIQNNLQWDANAFNSRNPQAFSYKDLYLPFNVNEVAFDSVITILQLSEKNLIEDIYIEEKFAPRVGMIYRKDKQLETELNGEIKNGHDVTYILISYN